VDTQQLPVIHNIVVCGVNAGCTENWLRQDLVVLDREVIASVFDDDTDTWALTTSGGESCRGRVVIAGQPPLVPWVPQLAGRDDFRGRSFHSAAIEESFDPAGRHVAVIGADAGAGQYICRLGHAAASVKVFPHSPRRVVAQPRGGWMRRRTPTELIRSPIDTVTASGIRTCDGVHHDADAIVYGTGFAVADASQVLVGARGCTIAAAWSDGMEPYLGIAVHGFPNYFLTNGPATDRRINSCLRLMEQHTRIEVRRSSQQAFNARVHLRRARHVVQASAFDLSSGAAAREDTYDGAAMLTSAGISRQVRVRLIGHIDPIDGQYHWQGLVFGELPADALQHARGAVRLTVGARSASARITEQTPQGTHSIAGVGAPPFMLDDVEVTVAQR
jgi:cation diffusion facilitator CzcD-associated flavoprotein CzcO